MIKQTGVNVGLTVLALLLIATNLLPALNVAASEVRSLHQNSENSDGKHYAGRVVVSGGSVDGVSASGRYRTQGTVGQGIAAVTVDNSVGFWWSIRASQEPETLPQVYLPIIIVRR